MLKIIFNGIVTGSILQLAIGPVFLFITNITIQRSLSSGLSAVLAVTLADYIYIILAIFGVGELLNNQKYKKIFGVTSAIVLIIFGILLLSSVINVKTSAFNSFKMLNDNSGSFIATFILTISNPLTIVFWTGLFTSKTLELKLARKELFIFGLSAGFASLLFLGTAVIIISIIKSQIPEFLLVVLNLLVGIILIIYAAIRIYKTIGSKDNFNNSLTINNSEITGD